MTWTDVGEMTGKWVIFSLPVNDCFGMRMDLISVAKKAVYVSLLAYFLYRVVFSIRKLQVGLEALD